MLLIQPQEIRACPLPNMGLRTCQCTGGLTHFAAQSQLRRFSPRSTRRARRISKGSATSRNAVTNQPCLMSKVVRLSLIAGEPNLICRSSRRSYLKDEFRTLDRSVLAGLQNSLGDENCMIVTTLANIYISTLAQRIQQMRLGTINKEMDMLKRTAHTLKGDSKQIGALRLGHLCERFELLIKVKEFADIPSLLIQIETESMLVGAELKAWLLPS